MSKKTYDPKTKTWKGPVVPSIYNTNLSVGQIILSVFKNTPEHVHQINADTDKRTTCYEMRMRIIRIAQQLIKLGYKKGDIVGVMAANSDYLSALTIACLTVGMPVSCIAPNFNQTDVSKLLGITRPKVIFCDSNLIGLIKEAVEDLKLDSPICTLLEKADEHKFLEDFLVETENEHYFIAPDLGDNSKLPAFIVFSSGTTGTPKGVVHSHKTIIETFCPFWELPRDKTHVFFNFSTFYWISGLIQLVTCALYNQTRVFTKEQASTKLFVEIVEKYNVTVFLTAPYFLAELVSFEELKTFPSIRHFFVGGSAVSKSLCKAGEKILPNGEVQAAYGCTEMAGVCVSTWPENSYGSAGKVFQNVEIKIIDDNGKKLGPMEKGEICLKIKTPFLGFYNDPNKTAEFFKDDFLHSGDIGYFDEDEFLYVIDRIKDILKYQRFFVSPSEIEDIINEMDLVVTSSVVGVPDEIGNDIVYAFVQRKNETLREEDVLNYVHGRVIDQKKIRGGVIFVNEFPLTATGKVIKSALKERIQKMDFQ